SPGRFEPRRVRGISRAAPGARRGLVSEPLPTAGPYYAAGGGLSSGDGWVRAPRAGTEQGRAAARRRVAWAGGGCGRLGPGPAGDAARTAHGRLVVREHL